MEKTIIRCRKCGKTMKSSRIDDYNIKFACGCGFSEYRPAPTKSKAINPHYSKESLVPLMFDSMGDFYIEVQRADRERMEILTLKELSMLASSDYDLDMVLKNICEKDREEARGGYLLHIPLGRRTTRLEGHLRAFPKCRG